MKAIHDFRNDLLKRREVKVVVKEQSNPGYKKAKEIIASHFKADDSTIVIRGVKGKFGRDTFLIDAFIYNSIKDKEKIEPKKKEKKETAK